MPSSALGCTGVDPMVVGVLTPCINGRHADGRSEHPLHRLGAYPPHDG